MKSPETKELFCKISLENREEWVHGLISYLNLKKNILEVFLSARDVRGLFSKNNRVIIKSLNDDNEFLFLGHVTKKVLSIRKQAIIIKIDEVKKFSNARKNERFHVRYAASIQSGNREPSAAIIKDVSLGGILLFSEKDLDDTQTVQINILVSNDKTIRFTGTILRKRPAKDGYTYGICLQSIDDRNMLLLNELIELLIVHKQSVAHEWKIFKRVKYTVYALTILFIFFVVFVILATEGM